jgi:hypothetical protein
MTLSATAPSRVRQQTPPLPSAVRLVQIAALALLSLPLISFAAVGWFSRYAADDYCTASQVALAGLLQAQSRLYVNWSGRFSATLFNTLLETVAVRAVPVLAATALLAWVAATAWAIRQLSSALGWRITTIASAMLAALLVYATLDTTADMPQDVYWQTGLLTYLVPLILAALFVGWVAKYACVPTNANAPLRVAVPFALAMLAGGTSETFAAAQVTALVLATAAALLLRGRVRGMLTAGLLGALVALAIIALAPGNEIRQEGSSRTPLLVALPEALDFTRGWLRLTFARPHAVVLALLALLPAGVAVTPGSRGLRRGGAALLPPSGPVISPRAIAALVLLVMAAALVVLACILPAFYALGSNPPGRAQLIPEFAVVATVAVLSWCIGAAASSALRRALGHTPVAAAACVALLALLVLGPTLSSSQALAQLNAASTYAASWDRIDGQIRADRNRGVEAVTVPPLPSTGSVQNLAWLGPDRTDWFNTCVAGYYGISSIAASSGE